MVYSYSVEVFYQLKKRKEKYPVAQLVGRTDLSLFPIAGYLLVGHPDTIALLYFLFFYPITLAHLGVNDLADIKNDTARKMNSVTILYDIPGTAWWVLLCTMIHFMTAVMFVLFLNIWLFMGFGIGFILLTVANYGIMKEKTSQAALKLLPLFHVTMILYAVSLIVYALL